MISMTSYCLKLLSFYDNFFYARINFKIFNSFLHEVTMILTLKFSFEVSMNHHLSSLLHNFVYSHQLLMLLFMLVVDLQVLSL